MATWTARDILDSIDEGKLRLAMAKAEAEAEAQRRLDEETASNEAAWKPIIAEIKQSIPQWAWEYLTHPNREPTFYNDCWMVVPATIDLQGMGQVFVYYWDSHPLFVPAEWVIQDDDESFVVTLPPPLAVPLADIVIQDDDESFVVTPRNGRSQTKYSLPGNPDFLIALAQAHANMEHYAEMKAEADRRNLERQKAKVEQPPTVQVDWLAAAQRAARPINADGNTAAAIAYALIGILEQLRKVTVPLYRGHAIQTFDNSRGLP